MATDADLVPAEMRAGSAVVYLGSAIHAGGANVTAAERRRGMHVSYCVGWLRTEENQYLSAPPDVVRAMPRQSQELLGYAAHDALMSGGGLSRRGRPARPGRAPGRRPALIAAAVGCSPAPARPVAG